MGDRSGPTQGDADGAQPSATPGGSEVGAGPAAPPPLTTQPLHRQNTIRETQARQGGLAGRRRFMPPRSLSVGGGMGASTGPRRSLRSPRRMSRRRASQLSASRSPRSSGLKYSQGGTRRRRRGSRVSMSLSQSPPPSEASRPCTPHTPRDALQHWPRPSPWSVPFTDVRPGHKVRMVPESMAPGRRALHRDVLPGMVVRLTPPGPDLSCCYVGVVGATDADGVLVDWREPHKGGPPDTEVARRQHIAKEWFDSPDGGRVWWFGDRYEGRVQSKGPDRVLVRWAAPEAGGPPESAAVPREQWITREWWDGDGRPTSTQDSTRIGLGGEQPSADSVTVHNVDRLAPDTNVVHPVVRWHLVDGATGSIIDAQPLPEGEGAAEEAERRQQIAVAGAAGQFTRVCDLRTAPITAHPLSPQWEHTFTGAKEGVPDLQKVQKEYPDALLLFEVLDFWYDGKLDIQRQYVHTGAAPQGWRRTATSLSPCLGGDDNDRGPGYGVYFYPVCWAFLKLSASGIRGAAPPRHRLQLYRFPHHRPLWRSALLRLWPSWRYPNAAAAVGHWDIYKKLELERKVAQGNVLPIFNIWYDPVNRIDRYPASLYVTLHRSVARRGRRHLRDAVSSDLDRRLMEVRTRVRQEWANIAVDHDREAQSEMPELPPEAPAEAGEPIDAGELLSRCALSTDGPPEPPVQPLNGDGSRGHGLQAALSGGTRGCLAVAFSPCGSFLALAACDDSKADLRVHDARYGPDPTGEPLPEGAEAVRLACPCVALFEGHSQTVYHVSWSPDGASLLTASADCTARVWDYSALPMFDWRHYRTTQVLAQAVQHGSGCAEHLRLPRRGGAGLTLLHPCHVYCAAWHPAGTVIATGGFDDTLRCWSAASGVQLTAVTAAPNSWIGAMSMERSIGADPVDPRLFTADGAGVIRCWRFTGARGHAVSRRGGAKHEATELDVSEVESMRIELFRGKRVGHMEVHPRRPKQQCAAPEPVPGLRAQLAAGALWTRGQLPKGRDPDERLSGQVTQVTRDEVRFQLDKDELTREEQERHGWEQAALRSISKDDWRAGFRRQEEPPKLYVWTAADSTASCLDLRAYAESQERLGEFRHPDTQGRHVELRHYRGRGWEGMAVRGSVRPDGAVLCTGSASGTVFFWDARKARGGQPCTLGHDHAGLDLGIGAPVWAVAWSPVDQRIAFASYGARLNHVTVWCRAARHVRRPAPADRPVQQIQQWAPESTLTAARARPLLSTVTAAVEDPLQPRRDLRATAPPSTTAVQGPRPRSPQGILKWWRERVAWRERRHFSAGETVQVTAPDGAPSQAEIVRWVDDRSCLVKLGNELHEVPARCIRSAPRAGERDSGGGSQGTARSAGRDTPREPPVEPAPRRASISASLPGEALPGRQDSHSLSGTTKGLLEEAQLQLERYSLGTARQDEEQAAAAAAAPAGPPPACAPARRGKKQGAWADTTRRRRARRRVRDTAH